MSRLTSQVNVEVYSMQADLLGEGPVWSATERALYWLDIGRRTLFCRAASDSRPRSWLLPDYPGCVAELARQGTIAVAFGEGVQRVDLRSGAIDLLCAAPQRRSGTRFNDGKVDPRGRFWAGTMQNNFGPNGKLLPVERSDGALYCFWQGGVRTVEEDLGIANTLAWAPDLRRFYFADSLQGQIYVYDFDADSGALSNKRMFFESSSCGVPDGSAIDVDGCLWNTRWDGSAVLRITPEGAVDRVVALPVPRPTSCAFGGENLDVLYVTSATMGLTYDQLEQYPLSGAVFAIDGIAQGMPVPAMVCD